MDLNTHPIRKMHQPPLVMTVPEAGELLGLGRTASYAAAKRGDIPTLALGKRLVVPRYALQQLLGPDVEAGAGLPGVDS